MIDWEQYYELGKWKGMDMYQCLVCPHSTIDGVTSILAHLSGHFPAQVKRDRAGIDLLDPAGAADEEE